jgi:hypothetical protein
MPKPKREQGELFPPPSLPPDVIRLCSACGGKILTQHFVRGGVVSEFRDAEGRCWGCSQAARKAKKRK